MALVVLFVSLVCFLFGFAIPLFSASYLVIHQVVHPYLREPGGDSTDHGPWVLRMNKTPPDDLGCAKILDGKEARSCSGCILWEYCIYIWSGSVCYWGYYASQWERSWRSSGHDNEALLPSLLFTLQHNVQLYPADLYLLKVWSILLSRFLGPYYSQIWSCSSCCLNI